MSKLSHVLDDQQSSTQAQRSGSARYHVRPISGKPGLSPTIGLLLTCITMLWVITRAFTGPLTLNFVI